MQRNNLGIKKGLAFRNTFGNHQSATLSVTIKRCLKTDAAAVTAQKPFVMGLFLLLLLLTIMKLQTKPRKKEKRRERERKEIRKE